MGAELDLGLVVRVNAVLDHYEGVANGAISTLHSKAGIFGPDEAEVSALYSVIGNNRRELKARREKVLAGSEDFDQFVREAKADEKDVADEVGYAIESSLDDVLAKTEAATGKVVSDTTTEVVGGAGRFVLSAIPWWAWVVGAGVVLWKFAPRGRRA